MNIQSQINEFLLTGEFENNIDEYNNINLYENSSKLNEISIVFPLENYLYDEQKIKSLYDVNLTQFVITKNDTATVSDQIDVEKEKLLEEKNKLQLQLNGLISQIDSNSDKSLLQASRDLIIELRIKLGEGQSDEEFSQDFPYAKIV